MKPILVHVHIFYPDLWAELKECIKNIAPHKFDLFVTMVEEHADVIADVKTTFPQAKIEIVENRGYDVGPFVHILNQLNLDNYSYVIKLHTKRNIIKGPYFRDMKYNFWRNNLLSFLASPEIFNQYLSAFEKNPHIGIQNNYKLIVGKDIYDIIAHKELETLLDKLNLPKLKTRFIAGTMFVARANIFKDVQQLNWNIRDFPQPDKSHKTQIAHVFERLIGYLAYKNNTIVTDGLVSEKFIKKYLKKITFYHTIKEKVIRFFYQKKITKSGKTRIKILRIPVPVQILKKILKLVYSVKTISKTEKRVRILGIKFKIKREISAEDRIKMLEKNIIAQSPFWDALWYIKKYNHQMNRYEALDYWYSKGWKKGESPSKYINLDYCRGAFDEVNPIICYMSKDEKRGFFPDDKNNFKSDNDFERIAEYLQYKNTRKAKSVVYTCITNGYDNIYELDAYGYINPEWDYVCFTDNQDEIKAQRIGIWEMRPLQFDKSDVSRINRWHKMHPHILFPEYEESIYIDSNINILTDFLFREIKRINQPFVLPRHFKNMCIYSEYNDVLQAKLDTAERINQARDFMKKEGMPQNYGFCENNVLYRQHHNTQIIAIMEEWWDLLEKYAKRDQLYLTYLFWKNNIRIEDITFENTRLLINDFYVFGHQKKGKKK